jgi:acyl-CoA reductase-like NAD-dependent aldehyde dehydrogenase
MSPEAREWSSWPFEDRAAVFLKAADLFAGKYREVVNASIMLTTGKTARECDIDNTEISDFYRYAPAPCTAWSGAGTCRSYWRPQLWCQERRPDLL